MMVYHHLPNHLSWSLALNMMTAEINSTDDKYETVEFEVARDWHHRYKKVVEVDEKGEWVLLQNAIKEREQATKEKINEITENIVKQLPTLIDKKIDLFSSKVNQDLNGI